MTAGGHGLITVGDGSKTIGSSDFTRVVLTMDPQGNGAILVNDSDHHLVAAVRKGPNTQGLSIYRDAVAALNRIEIRQD